MELLCECRGLYPFVDMLLCWFLLAKVGFVVLNIPKQFELKGSMNLGVCKCLQESDKGIATGLLVQERKNDSMKVYRQDKVQIQSKGLEQVRDQAYFELRSSTHYKCWSQKACTFLKRTHSSIYQAKRHHQNISCFMGNDSKKFGKIILRCKKV